VGADICLHSTFFEVVALDGELAGVADGAAQYPGHYLPLDQVVTMVAADSSQGEKCPAEAGHKCSVEMGCISRPLNLSSVKEADGQPLVAL
jgi:hypothetical protein